MQETKVICHKISSAYFNWQKDTNTFVAEMSDLSKHFNPMKQVWNDSADVGFVLIGEKTDKEVIFTFSHEDKNQEGEVQGWNFEIYLDNKTKALGMQGVKALIIND
jgi:hypothetical protein